MNFKLFAVFIVLVAAIAVNGESSEQLLNERDSNRISCNINSIYKRLYCIQMCYLKGYKNGGICDKDMFCTCFGTPGQSFKSENEIETMSSRYCADRRLLCMQICGLTGQKYVGNCKDNNCKCA